MSEIEKLVTRVQGHSLIFEKVDPAKRREIIEALVSHIPVTYQEVFDKFGLVELGVSFSSFYRFARRIRFHSTVMSMAESSLPSGADLIEAVPRILACHVLELADMEAVPVRELCRMVRAWHDSVRASLALDRQAQVVADDKRRARSADIDHLSAIMQHYAALRAQRIPDPTADNHPAQEIENEQAEEKGEQLTPITHS